MLLSISAWRSSVSVLLLAGGVAFFGFVLEPTCAQESSETGGEGEVESPVVVVEQSVSIDAATLVPPKLREQAEVAFAEASLSEVAQWLEKQTGLNVALDQHSLSDVGIDENSPVSDRLRQQPIFLLLDRLAQQKISWRLDGGVLRLHGLGDSSKLRNLQYNVGDLLDQKFAADDLEEAILNVVEAGSGWANRTEDGKGDLIFLGDVLFIRQDERTHRRIAGLLAALRTPTRRVLVDDPAEHGELRGALSRQITVQFKAKPLGAVVAELAEKTGIDMRLDVAALRTTKITERTPVNFELNEQSLQTTLDLLLGQYGLSWILRDGVLWLTPSDEAGRFLKTAVFDVRDICPNWATSNALQQALQQQVDSESWDDGDDETGQVAFAKPGVMVVRQSERRLDAVEELLGNYRVALKNSKRRISEEEDPEAIVTKYYRLPADVAAEMEKVIPELVAPESWKSDLRSEAAGTIRQVRSWAEVSAAEGTRGILIPQATLIVSQKRKIHEAIREFMENIKHGTSRPGGFGGGGMGGGGMGGGGGKMPTGGGIF